MATNVDNGFAPGLKRDRATGLHEGNGIERLVKEFNTVSTDVQKLVLKIQCTLMYI